MIFGVYDFLINLMVWEYSLYTIIKKISFLYQVVGLRKKLYFYKNDVFFMFASEIKAILAYLNIETKPNLNFLKNYLKCGCRNS